MIRRAVAAGVDFGGSWLRIALVDSDGRLVETSRVTAPSLESLPTELNRQLKRHRDSLTVLIVGSKGVWTSSEKNRLARQLSSLAPTVRVISDVEAAWQATFGERNQSGGILLVAGTGSIAYGRDQKNRTYRAGGLGPLLGDEGSAFWIGREYLKRIGQRVPGATVARLAQTSRSVFRDAQAGRRDAKDIIRLAATHLAQLVSSVEKQGVWSNPILWSTHGSLWKNSGFQKRVARLLPRRKSLIWKWVAPPKELVSVLARMAWHDIR